MACPDSLVSGSMVKSVSQLPRTLATMRKVMSRPMLSLILRLRCPNAMAETCPSAATGSEKGTGSGLKFLRAPRASRDRRHATPAAQYRSRLGRLPGGQPDPLKGDR